VRSPGHIALVLHAHLPYVRHPEHSRHLEEHWLFEAMIDCYLPILRVLMDAAERRSRFRLTVSLSPTLLSMFRDALLSRRFLDYLHGVQVLCERETSRHRGDAGRRSLARYYHQRIDALRRFYLVRLRGDLVSAWSELADAGVVELMTTTATHGYLPLLRSVPAAVRAQLRVASDYFKDLFGRAPEGLWLPECGYYPGLETEVRGAGFRWFVLDAHGVEQASPAPLQGVYAPVAAGEVAVFGRDPESAREVWSRDLGYPGHPSYREYHWDLGFEGDALALGDFLPPGVVAAPTGIKYFRVTGRTDNKALYDPQEALIQANRDAARFVERRRRMLVRLGGSPRKPLIVSPFDAELFGHWWFEGPSFLEGVIRRLDADTYPEPVTLGEYLERFGTSGAVQPAASSWGEGGYNSAWLRADTGWAHLRLHLAAQELSSLVLSRRGQPQDGHVWRLLRQAARTLLLAQSSDWTFHFGRGGGSDYAAARLVSFLARFRYLTETVRLGGADERKLRALEAMDNLFPALDLDHFAVVSADAAAQTRN
jgi:1,4-alpha-glucan branching enzyme